MDWLWAETAWLPPNVTWASFEPEGPEGPRYARFRDLLYPVPICLAMVLLRAAVERVVFRPLGRRLGLREGQRRMPERSAVLEAAYRGAGAATQGVAREAGLTDIQVGRWMRQRRRAELPSTLAKFQETGWRWLFYSTALAYGVSTLWSKPWVADIRHCWIGYPYHQVDTDVWIYYMVELSFYCSLIISQFFDVKRKDFWEMFIHHNVTIALIGLSWTAHFTRVGTLVILVHDCSDHLLEFAKMLKYTGYQKTCDIFFVLFAVTWIVTRCGIFPFWVLRSTLFDAGTFVQLFPLYYVFLILLGLLQVLNLVWTFFLFKAIKIAIVTGEAEDNRSDSEPSSEDENDNDWKKRN